MLGFNQPLLHLPHLSLGGSHPHQRYPHHMEIVACSQSISLPFSSVSILFYAAWPIFENYICQLPAEKSQIYPTPRFLISNLKGRLAGQGALAPVLLQVSGWTPHYHQLENDPFQVFSSPLAFPLTLFATIPLTILLAINQSLFRSILIIVVTFIHLCQIIYHSHSPTRIDPPSSHPIIIFIHQPKPSFIWFVNVNNSQDKATRQVGWFLFLAAYSLFLVDLILSRFPNLQPSPGLLQIEEVSSSTISLLASPRKP